MIAKTYSVWYYKWIEYPFFNPEDPTTEQEEDYDLILKQIREGTFTEEQKYFIAQMSFYLERMVLKKRSCKHEIQSDC